MLKILSKVFPLIDYLYIFQLLEYKSWDFLKWWIKNPLKRNLERKHKIEWTNKAKLLFLISLVLILIDSIKNSYLIFNIPWLTPILIIFAMIFSPLILIFSQILISPLEYFQKQKILEQTSNKLKDIPDLKIIAITGSYGKTSTKDILYTLLWKKFRVVKTPKSFNTNLGVAQTILEDVKKNTEILVAEVGAYKKGEIRKIVELIKPDIGIITAIGPQHLERFGNLENIAKAKFEIVEVLDKNGLAILNKDSELLVNLANNAASNVIYFNDPNGYFITNVKTSVSGTSFTLNTPHEKAQIEIPLIGEHHAKNFLAASIAAINLGLSLKEIEERAKLLFPTPHRLAIKKQGSITIIDNSYNTNPDSSKESLKLLEEYSEEQKIIITPGLVELGKESEKENIEFAENSAKVADEIIIVGENAKKNLLEGLRKSNFPKEKIHTVEELKVGLDLLPKIAKPDAVVLLENDLPDQYF